MADENRFSDLLKIPEAAQYLNVTRRWIYRRIWSGDLPASKVGGLYFIRRQDIDSLLEQGKPGGTGRLDPEALQSVLKCGHCFRLLENDALIGEVCQAENCEQLICTQCVAEENHFCVEHLPDKELLWEQALEAFRQGEYHIAYHRGPGTHEHQSAVLLNNIELFGLELQEIGMCKIQDDPILFHGCRCRKNRCP